jgi:hypothetical protein
MPIEKHFDIPFISNLALREKQIQQNYRPIIAVHKWFARRPLRQTAARATRNTSHTCRSPTVSPMAADDNTGPKETGSPSSAKL